MYVINTKSKNLYVFLSIHTFRNDVRTHEYNIILHVKRFQLKSLYLQKKYPGLKQYSYTK